MSQTTALTLPSSRESFQSRHDVPARSSEQLLQRPALLQPGGAAVATASQSRPLADARFLQPESQAGGQPPEGAQRWASPLQPAPHVLCFGQVRFWEFCNIDIISHLLHLF